MRRVFLRMVVDRAGRHGTGQTLAGQTDGRKASKDSQQQTHHGDNSPLGSNSLHQSPLSRVILPMTIQRQRKNLSSGSCWRGATACMGWLRPVAASCS